MKRNRKIEQFLLYELENHEQNRKTDEVPNGTINMWPILSTYLVRTQEGLLIEYSWVGRTEPVPNRVEPTNDKGFYEHA